MGGITNRIVDLDIGYDYVLKSKNYLERINYNIDAAGMGHVRIPISTIKDDFIHWLGLLGLEIKLAECFYCAPNGSIPVHSDETNPPGCCKLNWAYCESSVTIDWYDYSKDIKLEYKDNSVGGYYLTCDPEHYQLSSSAIVGKPSLVQVSDLHAVTNNTGSPWYCFCLVLKKKNQENHRINWNEATEIFKSYILHE